VTGRVVVSHHKGVLAGETAIVKVDQFALLKWNNASIPVLVGNVFWVGVNVVSVKSTKVRTNDSTALCEGNVAIGDDGGFSQRIDVKKFFWRK